MSKLHWSAKYVGLPFIEGEFDCAVLAETIQREVFGRSPEVPGERWYMSERGRERLRQMAAQIDQYKSISRKVEVPEDGDAALIMVRGRPMHLGVYCLINGEGYILHMLDGQQSVLTKILNMEVRGFTIVGYYRPLK